MSALYDRLRHRATSDPSSPFVSWYGADGARAELSGITFATSVAKTAGMLTDDLDLEPGAAVRLALPLHWQLPVWVAAAHLAGLTVAWYDTSPVDVTVFAEPGEPATAGMSVVSAATAFGRPDRPVPAPFVDHFSAAMGQPDVYLRVPARGDWLVDGTSWDTDGIVAAAQRLTGPIAPGAHVLVPPGTGVRDAALMAWVVPLLTGGSGVLVQEGDADRVAAVAAAEHARFAPGA